MHVNDMAIAFERQHTHSTIPPTHSVWGKLVQKEKKMAKKTPLPPPPPPPSSTTIRNEFRITICIYVFVYAVHSVAILIVRCNFSAFLFIGKFSMWISMAFVGIYNFACMLLRLYSFVLFCAIYFLFLLRMQFGFSFGYSLLCTRTARKMKKNEEEGNSN